MARSKEEEGGESVGMLTYLLHVLRVHCDLAVHLLHLLVQRVTLSHL